MPVAPVPSKTSSASSSASVARAAPPPAKAVTSSASSSSAARAPPLPSSAAAAAASPSASASANTSTTLALMPAVPPPPTDLAPDEVIVSANLAAPGLGHSSSVLPEPIADDPEAVAVFEAAKRAKKDRVDGRWAVPGFEDWMVGYKSRGARGGFGGDFFVVPPGIECASNSTNSDNILRSIASLVELLLIRAEARAQGTLPFEPPQVGELLQVEACDEHVAVPGQPEWRTAHVRRVLADGRFMVCVHKPSADGEGDEPDEQFMEWYTRKEEGVEWRRSEALEDGSRPMIARPERKKRAAPLLQLGYKPSADEGASAGASAAAAAAQPLGPSSGGGSSGGSGGGKKQHKRCKLCLTFGDEAVREAADTCRGGFVRNLCARFHGDGQPKLGGPPASSGSGGGSWEAAGASSAAGAAASAVKKLTPYNLFMKREQEAIHRDEQPGIAPKEAFKIAASRWADAAENPKNAARGGGGASLPPPKRPKPGVPPQARPAGSDASVPATELAAEAAFRTPGPLSGTPQTSSALVVAGGGWPGGLAPPPAGALKLGEQGMAAVTEMLTRFKLER